MTFINPYRFAVDAGATFATQPIFVVKETLNSGAGTQDITIDGIGTPKAAIVIAVKAGSGDGTSTDSATVPPEGSCGMTDGTGQYCGTWTPRDTNRVRGGYDDRIIKLNSDGASAVMSSLITDGIRLNVTAGSTNVELMVILIGGSSTSVYINFAQPSGTPSFTTGFESDLVFTMSSTRDFSANGDSGNNTTYALLGMASWDGSTLAQAGLAQSLIGQNVTGGQVRTDSVIIDPNSATNRMSVSSVGSTTVDFDAGSWGASTIDFMGLCVDFGGAYSAWVGAIDFPTSTGSQSLPASGGPSFTPTFAMSFPNFITATSTVDSTGGGMAFGVSATDGTREACFSWRANDASGSGGSTGETSMADSQMFNVDDHRQQNSHEGAFSGFSTGSVDISLTAAYGTAAKVPLLLVG